MIDALALCFALAQEQFVVEACPPPTSPVVRALGSPRHDEREAAEVAIALGGVRELPTIAAAMASRDAEVRRRGGRLAHRLFRCPDCRGVGLCVVCEGQDRACNGCNYWYDCRRCLGSGDVRFTIDHSSTAINGEYYPTAGVIPRDLVNEWLLGRKSERERGP